MKTSNKLIIGWTVSSILGRVLEKAFIKNNISPNTETTFNFEADRPTVDSSAYIHPYASVMGSVDIGKEIFVGPYASIRGDEGLKIHLGNFSNVQDGVILHGLKNFEYKSMVVENSVFKDNVPYSIYIGEEVTLAPQSQVHGPCRIDSNVFIGMQCFAFDSYIEENVVLEPGSKVIGVTIPKNSYVAAGRIITSQVEADQLPKITPQYRYYDFNKKIVINNRELVLGYKRDGNKWRI